MKNLRNALDPDTERWAIHAVVTFADFIKEMGAKNALELLEAIQPSEYDQIKGHFTTVKSDKPVPALLRDYAGTM